MLIFGIGITVVDHVIQIPAYPPADSKTTISRHLRQVGGPVPTALSTVAFYGAKAILLSRWGEDDAGEFVQKQLPERKIDTSLCKTYPDWETGFAQVWLDTTNGKRTLASFPGNFPPITAADIDQPEIAVQLAEAQILHLDGTYPEATLRAARVARQDGTTIVLDAGSSKPGMEQLFPLVDVLIASKLFRQSYFGLSAVTADQLRALGATTVITTEGERGASCYTPDDQFHEPSINVDAIDTNGAGDIFSGAVLFGLSQEWPLRKTIRFANQVAGYSCGRHGNYSLPDPSNLDAMAK